MENRPQIIDTLLGYAQDGADLAMGWLLSPAAWSQFALLVVAWFAARLLARRADPLIAKFLTPRVDQTNLLAEARHYVLRFVPLLMPLLAWVFTAIGEEFTRSLFGSGAVIALGKRVFLFIAIRLFVQHVLRDPFLKLMGKYVLLPLAALYAVGLLDVAQARLAETRIILGDINFSVLALIRGAIAGALLIWVGRWSNGHSEDYIKKQEALRPSTRELAIKAAQIVIYGTAFLLLMSIMGIDLTAIVVLGGAIGVGVGLGLQQIASNFISGVILLLEGLVTVGDYVRLDDDQEGTIIKMTSRAVIIETIDGRWIVVPNEDFITTRVTSFSEAGTAHRYECEFSVSYDTDITAVPALIEKAVQALPFVLTDPEPVECELRELGESGVVFGVEYWVNGIEDLTEKFRSQVLMCVWTTLRAEGIEIPYPQRVLHMRTAPDTPPARTPKKSAKA